MRQSYDAGAASVHVAGHLVPGTWLRPLAADGLWGHLEPGHEMPDE